MAAALRFLLVATCSYILHPDETYQYLEQGHRLAFGSGIVPWEYHDGIRSWLLPGAIASLMRLASLFSDAPETYIWLIRVACVASSLVVPYVAFRIADRQFGRNPAIAAGLFCALWYDLVYFASVAMTEEQATHLALLAFWLGWPSASGTRVAPHRAALAGVLWGLAVCLRFQYGPALAIAAFWQHRRDRLNLIVVAVVAMVTISLGAGLLDVLTWGSPFQSIWLNLRRNTFDGISSALGVAPWFSMPLFFIVSWGTLFPLLVGLGVLGSLRAPALAIAAIMTIIMHSIMPHKEVRFIYLALATVPVLLGLGIAWLLTFPILRRPGATVAVCAMIALIAGSQALRASATVLPAERLRTERSTTRAFYAAHSMSGLCGLGVGVLPVYFAGGYTYLHRDVPIYFEAFEHSQHIPGLAYRFRLSVILDGIEIPQYPDAEFAATSRYFNGLIAPEDAALPGFKRIDCFGTDDQLKIEICLFRRAGACS